MNSNGALKSIHILDYFVSMVIQSTSYGTLLVRFDIKSISAVCNCLVILPLHMQPVNSVGNHFDDTNANLAWKKFNYLYNNFVRLTYGQHLTDYVGQFTSEIICSLS